MSSRKNKPHTAGEATLIDSSGPFERWAVYCSCGCTIFGNTKEQAEKTWESHASGKLK